MNDYALDIGYIAEYAIYTRSHTHSLQLDRERKELERQTLLDNQRLADQHKTLTLTQSRDARNQIDDSFYKQFNTTTR